MNAFTVVATALVGYLAMSVTIFEPFREWTLIVRRRKGSKNPVRCSHCVGAKEYWQGDGPASTVRSDINTALEPIEFMTEQRYLWTTWLNIKQLTEPQDRPVEFISTSPIISHAKKYL